MITGPDRLKLLLDPAQDALTGLDYVAVGPGQVQLDAHFHKDPDTLASPLSADLAIGQITIQSEDPDEPRRRVDITGITWPVVEGERVLRISVDAPGGFSWYRLSIDDIRLDRFFNSTRFSFKAGCPSDVDCAPSEPDCPEEPQVDFPVDYGAKDFWSLRQALLDFASERYPGWQDRLEADQGVMLAEALSALGDELSYYQDNAAREAHLETAAQRRSVRRHARLVDYELHDGLCPWTWVDVTVATGMSALIVAGSDLWAQSHSETPAAKSLEPSSAGEAPKVHYEAGWGLSDILAGTSYAFTDLANSLEPYIWEEDSPCLPQGATSLHVRGLHSANLPWNDTPDGSLPGRWVLLRNDPPDPSEPARRWPVRLVGISEEEDALTGQGLTLLTWESDQALPWELDLSHAQVRGNLLPATCGKTFPHTGGESAERVVMESEPEALGLPESETLLLASSVEIPGPRCAAVSVYTLPGSEVMPLAYVGQSAETAKPEVALWREEWIGGAWVRREDWTVRRSLVGITSSQPQDRDYTLEDGAWRKTAAFPVTGGEYVHADYAGQDGKSLRFGDGEFGRQPAKNSVFAFKYRLWQPEEANVGQGALKHFDALAFAGVESLENPLPVTGGVSPEKIESLRKNAPYAYQAVQYRAVRPEDYREAAERLPWTQTAGAVFQWTGSWRTGLVTPDPVGITELSEEHREELEVHLERFRQAGHSIRVAAPRYADLDLRIHLCLKAGVHRGQFLPAALKDLLGKGGFFGPDHFTFGTPLRSSALQARLQAISGVKAVGDLWLRRRGFFEWRPFLEPYLPVEPDTIIRVENDPVHPQRGSLRLELEGGI